MLAGKGVYGFLVEILAVDDNAEEVFVEPAVGEGEISPVAGSGAPAVLELPLDGNVIVVGVAGHNKHGV